MDQSEPTSLDFNPHSYITSLMGAIGFDEATEEEKDKLYKLLSQQIGDLIARTVSLHAEADQIDETLENYGDLKDLGEFVTKLVEISPEAQLALINELDRFYAQTLEAYERFNKV